MATRSIILQRRYREDQSVSSSSSHPLGFCHWWPAWPQHWGQVKAQFWGKREIPASWGPSGSSSEGVLLGASQVERSAKELCSPGHCVHFSTTRPLIGEKPPHSEMESWITCFKDFNSDPAHLTPSLSVAYSLSNFDCYLSLFPNNLWENML